MYLSYPDIKIAMQNAIFNFNSKKQIINNFTFDKLKLNFNQIDENKWLPIKWAKDFLINKYLSQPIIINASDDYLFDLIKREEITFNHIIPDIEKTINKFINHKISKIEDVYLLNNLIREWLKGKNYE